MVHVDRGRGALHGCRLPRAGSNAESVYGRSIWSSVSVATGREGRSGVPPVSTLSSFHNLFQSVVTEKIKECGFYVMDIDDKRLGAEVMYLRFLDADYRRARVNAGKRRARQRRRRVPGYMRGRSRFCEHCRKSFMVGSLATTCPIDRCGNLHWTCLRPHAEKCHPLKCV